MERPRLVVLPVGTIFHDRYKIVRRIATGGMGVVYEAIHVETQRRRALKVLPRGVVADERLRARFRREATITAELKSEHLVETLDAGIDAATGCPFLVMELLRGEDLSALLERRGALSGAEVVALLDQAARALDETHAAGIVHRDIKPQNLFVATREDGALRLKILDFGIAKVISRSVHLSVETGGAGTPLFMAPEQIHRAAPLGPATDLYALAQVAFTLLVGEPYWAQEVAGTMDLATLFATMARGPVDAASLRATRKLVTLPAAFDPWFAKATAREPSARFSRASELVAALAGALGLPEPQRPSSAPGPWIAPVAAERGGGGGGPSPGDVPTMPLPPSAEDERKKDAARALRRQVAARRWAVAAFAFAVALLVVAAVVAFRRRLG